MMANTYSKMYVHIVFTVKYRQALISEEWEELLYKYITGIVKNKEQVLLAINGMPDHIHILIRYRPSCVMSDLVREIKKSSTEFIKINHLTPHKFQWQEGYGAFTLSESGLSNVVKYIENQKTHHKRVAFKKEFETELQIHKIDYNSSYIFEEIP